MPRPATLDAFFLAALLGGSSKVLGSDRRLEAIEAAAKRLRGSPIGQRVRSI